MSNRRFTAALAAALADLGLEHACLSPGSRNTPLLAALAAEDRIDTWTILDERSAGFFALGLARATGKPVALSCTSGTAAAEYLPAVVEASQSDIPLLVLTADRPPELRDLGAPQTIDQVSLYGTAVRMFADALPPDEVDSEQASAIAIDIWAHATAIPPGPVHLNLPFREPLLEAETVGSHPSVSLPRDPGAAPPELDQITSRLGGRQGLIVAGRDTDPGFPGACAGLAAATGFPIVADPLSGLRFGPHEQSHVLGYGDQLAGAGAFETLRPEVVVRFGPVPTSKPVWQWLERNPDVDQILIDVQSRDATRSARTTLEIPPTAAALAMAAGVESPAPHTWIEAWRELDAIAGSAIEEHLDRVRFLSEPQVSRIVAASAPTGSILAVGSSMPIRDIDGFAGSSPKPLRLFGNRGANGIDGVVSAALGSAATGTNTVVLVGDVSLFHDLNVLGTAAQLALPITIVVVNNDGGGIFHFLPQHDPAILETAIFAKELTTPHGTDFVPIAQALGIEARDVDEPEELRSLLATTPRRPRLLQVRTDREVNHQLHSELSATVRIAVKSRLEASAEAGT